MCWLNSSKIQFYNISFIIKIFEKQIIGIGDISEYCQTNNSTPQGFPRNNEITSKAIKFIMEKENYLICY